MEKEIEQWIKTSISEWIATDGLESVIILSFQDTEFRNVAGIVSEAVLEAFDNGITTENSVEAGFQPYHPDCGGNTHSSGGQVVLLKITQGNQPLEVRISHFYK